MLEYIRGDNINKMHQSNSEYNIVQNVDTRLSSFDFANVVAISEKGTAIITGVTTSASEIAAAVSSPSHTCMLLAACLQCIPTPTQTPELQFHVRLLFLLLLLLYLKEKNEAVDVAVVKLTEKHDKNMKQQ